MPSTVEYDDNLEVVHCTFVGQVTVNDFKEATFKSFKLAKENNTSLFLIDDSKWEGGASIIGIYELPELYEELGFDRNSRAALILPADGTVASNDTRFYRDGLFKPWMAS